MLPPELMGTATYKTNRGLLMQGTVETLLSNSSLNALKGKVQLIFTSPPFPLNRKKKYGNLKGEEYLQWFESLAQKLKPLLNKNGSIVLELGNSWEPGEPVMSTLALEALLAFKKAGNFHLCQQFICHNPARLPSPAQWVNIERIRIKDAFTHLWWLSSTTRPYADNRSVLTPYSGAMKRLLGTQKYNSGIRPSEYQINATTFLVDNGGAIPSNVLTISNTKSSDVYLKYCRANKHPIHPARMPADLATFFVEFLTKKGQIVLDPFAGSNTTGAVAEGLERRWVSIEPQAEYIRGSFGRFQNCEGAIWNEHAGISSGAA